MDDISNPFADGWILSCAVEECSQNIKRLYMALGKLELAKNSGRGAEMIERLKWPLKKEEYEKDMQTLRRLLRIFEFSLNLSSCELLSKTSAQLEANQQKLLTAIHAFEEATGSVSKELLQRSNDITEALGLYRSNPSSMLRGYRRCLEDYKKSEKTFGL
ncbi:Similar to ankyrin [Exophiala dermatitidis NIH/UT8656]; acc. no. EHY59712 [Pyronema omphalodes CBS 100304]|uniref:Similar to ankyrin [Exophiala dermatitidis NIH/UT8656] acc. no. EHY59712 n=1 Tax=Pyronema omphalodes (strain CBS 100304) TaxID=1076935 RepID=U4LWX8_PYROM|nr:Similar to ankyrin [Exophiala dermatitidis NIH/UT8656]; acc. no. EHY59712 [Pyronema omphalodes CBS 100304]